MTTIANFLKRSEEIAGLSDTPLFDMQLLLCYVLKCSSAELYADTAVRLDPEQQNLLSALFQKRVSGVPIAYLTGCKGFWTLKLQVSEATLIPRPETELLVEIALTLPLPEAATVLDLGTGCGSIVLSLSSERRNWVFTGTDNSTDALKIAETNRKVLKFDNVNFEHGDWYGAVAGKRYHLIVSNPPYVAEGDHHLSSGDLRYEPQKALTAGVDGLNDLKKVIGQAPDFLFELGWLVTEHGSDQGDDVRNLYEEAGFGKIFSHKDLNGLERVTMGCVKR